MSEPHLDVLTLTFAAAIMILPWVALDYAERREARQRAEGDDE